MATGDAGAVDLFVLLEPPHRDGSVRRAMRVWLSLDQRLPICIEDGHRVIRRRTHTRTGHDEACGDRPLKQDATLNVTSAPAGPRVRVEVHGRNRRARV